MKKEELKTIIKECILEEQETEIRKQGKRKLLRIGRKLLDEMDVIMKKELGI